MSSDAEDIYKTLIEKGFSESDIKEQIEKKTREFSGFITQEGALFLVAKDNNIGSDRDNKDIEYEGLEDEIDYDEFAIPISEVREGLSNIVLVGRISRVFPVRQFTRKDGSPGIVGNFMVSDGKNSIKIVLWDQTSKIMETDFFREDEVIRVIGGYSKVGLKEQLEIHIGKKGTVILAPTDVNARLVPPPLVSEELCNRPTIEGGSNISVGDLLSKEGFIPEISGTIRDYDLTEIEKKNGGMGFLLKLNLLDGTGTIRVKLWDDNAVSCLSNFEENSEVIMRNILVKLNLHINQKEIAFTSKSTMTKS